MTSRATIDNGVASLPADAAHWPFPALRDALAELRDAARVVRIDLTGTALLAWNARELRWFERYPLPVVAAVRGETGGQALALALACDVRLAADDATLDLATAPPERLATLLGGRAAETGVPLTAPEARMVGLVSVVTPPDGLDAAAARVAGTIAARGPIATQLAKEAIWRGLDMPIEQAFRFETDLTLLLQTTNDRAEGVAAFVAKRPPQFTGK